MVPNKIYNISNNMKNKILKLVNNLEFQELKSDALIAWWLNPKSDHGLGYAPLKEFLRLAATKNLGKATFGIDGFEGAFYNRVLAGNYKIELLEDIELDKNGIDIWTVIELSYEEYDKTERRIIPVVIENKTGSTEGKGLTERYLNAIISYPGVENIELSALGILLSEEPAEPSCNQFDNITYHELLTYVIEPLVTNEGADRASEDECKYIVSHNGKAIFPGKRLSRSMTACAIFKAYLEQYPATTLNQLQEAFPCEMLNAYYYDRYYKDLFYESNPDNIDFGGYEVLPRTAGQDIGSEVEARFDFYLDDNQLLPIENGTKRAMCVKMWFKADFDRLIKHVHDKGFDDFISIEKA